ncbi:MAG: alpha/beta hydrolase [Bryobacteraceae bacterium]
MRIGLFVLGVALMPAWAQQPVAKASRWIEQTREEPVGTRYKTFQSKTISAPMSYLLYLPPDYELQTDRRYPVLYWLPGGQLDQRTGGSVAATLDRAIRENKLPPLIIVVPHGPAGSMWTDSRDRKEPVETVIVRDLIPHVDGTYRTITAREGRWIEGFSMGGRGAAHLGLEYPELFGAVSILAGALTGPEFFSKFNNGEMYHRVFDSNPEYFRQHDPPDVAEKNAATIRGKTLVRILVGDQDTMGNQVPGFTCYQFNINFHETLERLRIPHEYKVVPGARHAYQPLYNSLGDSALEFFRRAAARIQGARFSPGL